MRTAGIFAAVALTYLSFGSSHARADASKAWAAAKLGLPADAKLVVGVDLAALQKTQLFATFYPELLQKAEVKSVIDSIKDTCKIDPLTAVKTVVVAIADDQKDGAVYIAFSGVDKAKLSSCLQSTVQGIADKTAKISLKQDGNVTEISDGKDTVFFGWAGKDVLVVPVRAQDKSSLQKWMDGKSGLAKSDLGKRIAKVNTSAALWGAGEGTKEIQSGVTAKGGYGAVTFSKGNLDADVHAVMENAAQATKMAGDMKKQIEDVKQLPQVPSAAVAMLKAVTIAPANDEIVIKANLVEKDLLSVLSFARAAMGGP